MKTGENKCKTCISGEKFVDKFTGKERYSCGIGQEEHDRFGDRWLIIDGECEKWTEGVQDDERMDESE